MCRKKQGGGVLKIVGIVFLAFIIIGALGNALGGNKPDATKSTGSSSTEKATEPTAEVIEYTVVTANQLEEDLNNNALKASETYKNEYLEVTGKFYIVDASGKYFTIKSDEMFSLTNIQCYIKSDEIKNIVMELSKDQQITVRGKCKDIGELIGYQIDVIEIIE